MKIEEWDATGVAAAQPPAGEEEEAEERAAGGPEARLRRARQLVESGVLLSEQARALHPFHSLRHDAFQLLAVICGRLGDHEAQARYTGLAVRLLTGALGSGDSSELARAYHAHGAALAALAGELQGDQVAGTSAAARQALLDAIRMRKVALGVDHPLTRASAALLARLR